MAIWNEFGSINQINECALHPRPARIRSFTYWIVCVCLRARSKEKNWRWRAERNPRVARACYFKPLELNCFWLNKFTWLSSAIGLVLFNELIKSTLNVLSLSNLCNAGFQTRHAACHTEADSVFVHWRIIHFREFKYFCFHIQWVFCQQLEETGSIYFHTQSLMIC